MLFLKLLHDTSCVNKDWHGFEYGFLVWDALVQSHDPEVSQRVSFLMMLPLHDLRAIIPPLFKFLKPFLDLKLSLDFLDSLVIA